MSNQYVGVNPDGAGKKIQTFENVVGGNTVESQATTLVDSTSVAVAVSTSAPAGSENAIVVRNIPSGTQSVADTKASTAATSNVAASVTTVTVLAANAARLGAMVFNDSAAASLYLKMGASASTTSFTVLIAAGGYYELPQPVYTGNLTAVWSAANGTARVTETS